MRVLEERVSAASRIPVLSGAPRQMVFLTEIDSELNAFLREIHQVALFEPSLIERIEEDLELHGKKKKLLRLADAQFRAGQTPDLPKLKIQLRQLKLEEITLEEGRPRTGAYVVYVFLMLRGFNGGCKEQYARMVLEESITLRLWLEQLGVELPPASTLSDNINAVSNATRQAMQQAQLRYIVRQGLDDFKKCFIDSTAVEASSERPTDSALLVKLIDRICAGGGNLHRLGLPDMAQVGLKGQQEELRGLSQQILFLNGKARGQAKRKKLYYQLLRRAERLRNRLVRDFEPVRKSLEGRKDLPPSRRLMAEEALGLIAGDLAALEQAADACRRRVMEEKKVPMEEKIVSISDPDAAFIVKGGWNSVVGYRPQLARSGGGFVSALILPRGNAADSPQLLPVVKEQIANTGVIPSLVSADDGYSSLQGRQEVLGLGVKVVSISGAKGKKITGALEWKSEPYRQARAERSAIESLIFTLKRSFEFGELNRRTQDDAHAEMLEKILAYNISQIIRVRKRLSEFKDAQRTAA